MPLFSQHPFSGSDVDLNPMPFDTMAAINKEIRGIAANYNAGNADVYRRISPLQYRYDGPIESAQGRISFSPVFLPSKITV